MNRDRRKRLTTAQVLLSESLSKIEEATGIFEECSTEERDYADNMPENLQYSEKGQMAQQYADTLDDLAERLSEASSTIEEARDESFD